MPRRKQLTASADWLSAGRTHRTLSDPPRRRIFRRLLRPGVAVPDSGQSFLRILKCNATFSAHQTERISSTRNVSGHLPARSSFLRNKSYKSLLLPPRLVSCYNRFRSFVIIIISETSNLRHKLLPGAHLCTRLRKSLAVALGQKSRFLRSGTVHASSNSTLFASSLFHDNLH